METDSIIPGRYRSNALGSATSLAMGNFGTEIQRTMAAVTLEPMSADLTSAR